MSRLTRFSVENQSPLIKIHKFHTHTHTKREKNKILNLRFLLSRRDQDYADCIEPSPREWKRLTKPYEMEREDGRGEGQRGEGSGRVSRS